jgi:ferredoxin
MKHLYKILIIILLLGIALMQFMAVQGAFPKQEKQDVCPVNAIRMIDGKAVIDGIKCIGCGRCVDGFVAIPNTLHKARAKAAGDKALEAEQSRVQTAKPIAAEPAVKPEQPSFKPETQAGPKPQEGSYYKVDSQQCISCGLCLAVCPSDAISYVDGKAFIDKDKCIDCGLCAGAEEEVFAGCPVEAISRVEKK